ncbi:MAG: hypothetical protein GAK29_05050 [Acinetobacter bereziniae]|uniref:Uncharacterized protein n=1 Tax=Acinetobacter bereziniae TaxID=106648 RepID=A0A833U8J9_ACIBZ|nr:MAG: hypothetical protein GAK29_05050 [Acinetobacter bereziniae]
MSKKPRRKLPQASRDTISESCPAKAGSPIGSGGDNLTFHRHNTIVSGSKAVPDALLQLTDDDLSIVHGGMVLASDGSTKFYHKNTSFWTVSAEFQEGLCQRG